MKKQVPLAIVVGLALVIVAVVGYFALVRPKQAENARLDEEIAELQTKVDAALAATRQRRPGTVIRVADIFELSKAMPGKDDMPGIILELNSIATASGIQFLSITPKGAIDKQTYRALPISLTFEGNYFDLTDFLFRLRNLVAVRDGRLRATGRLFTLDALDMHEAQAGFPQIEAVLTISAYAYGGATSAAAPPAPEATPTTTTTAELSQDAVGAP
jgi:type IV pilus assembly protein PilOP